MGQLNDFNLELFAGMDNSGKQSKKQPETTHVASDSWNPQSITTDVRAQIAEVVGRIVQAGLDITIGYQAWLNLGFALSDELGEDGREIYHQLSQMNSGYNQTECDKQYTACLKSHGSGITIKTFFKMAQDAGIDLSQIAREQMLQLPVSATSANTPNANNIEKVVKNTVFDDFGNGLADGAMAEVAENPSEGTNGYTFTDKLNIDDLPSFLQVVISKHSDSTAKCDAMILGMLNVVSGIMGMANGTVENRSGVYGIYDGRRVYAPVFNIIYGSAGNEKGNLIFCKLLAYPIKAEMRRKYEQEKQKYEEELADYETKGKKERGPAPKEPVYRDPFVPGNSSSSAAYRALDANNGCGLMFETEADTVTSMIDSDYGNYSDLMRKAHHHESLTMGRVQDKIHIDIDEPRLSVLLTCTPGQLTGLFPNFENGLGSRFLFYNLPDEKLVFHDVFALTKTPLEDTYKELGNKLMPLYHAMLSRAGHPVQFLMSQSQQKEFLATYSEMLQEQFKMLGKGISAFIFRMALECFRYAMILTTMRKLADWQAAFNPSNPDQKSLFDDDENGFVCDDRDFRTSMTIMGCLINHTARVYAVMAKEDNNPFALKGIKISRDEIDIYNAIPVGEFRTADIIAIAGKKDIPERTAQRYLSNFCNVYRIVNPVRRGVYMKPAKKED